MLFIVGFAVEVGLFTGIIVSNIGIVLQLFGNAKGESHTIKLSSSILSVGIALIVACFAVRLIT